MKIKIKSRFDARILFSLETETLRLCVEAAIKSRANLSCANLSCANLSDANLSGANLFGADLSGADLSRVNLSDANLSGANLSGANLFRADLFGADLFGADLSGADLFRVDLSGANLSRANLSDANLSGVNLSRANLSRVKNAELAFAQTVIVPEGALIVWKRCEKNLIVKMRVPEDARRSNAGGRKCRFEFVDVLEVIGGKIAVSSHDRETCYVAGKRVICDRWNPNRWNECSGGIHAFLTRVEAEKY